LTKLQNFIPDLIVLDIVMPGMDGFRFLEKKRKLKSAAQIPVIILTSKIGYESEQHAQELGAVDYLVKPVSINIFVKAIHDTLMHYSAMRVN